MTFNLMAFGPYALVIVAGLFAHACYALPLSVLTMLNAHVIGRAASHSRVLNMSLGYIVGNSLASLAILASLTHLFVVLQFQSNVINWIFIAALSILIGWLTLLFYYRKGKGTKLWLPRVIVERISRYAKRSRTVFSAFSIGILTVFIELPFVIAPFIIASSILSTLPTLEQTIGQLTYTAAVIMPLLVVTVLMGGGYKLSTIQRWRETNKKFLQSTSGISLVLLGMYIFAIKIWGHAA